METTLAPILLVIGALAVAGGLVLKSMMLEARLQGYREGQEAQRRREIVNGNDRGGGCLFVGAVIFVAVIAWLLSSVGGF